MAKKMKQLFALLLTLSMTMSLLGVTAFAEDTTDDSITELETALEAAKAKQTEAAAAVTEAQSAYDNAVEEALAEGGALAGQAAGAAAAQEKLEAAQAEAEAAQAEAEAAQAALDALEEGADRTEAEEALSRAQEAFSQKQSGQRAAEAEVETANADLEAAKQTLPEYAALTEARTALLDAQEKVEAAQAALDDAHQELAQPAIAAINAIAASGFENNFKTKTDEQKQAVADARTAYDALPDAAKAQVTNYETLTAAEKYLSSVHSGTKWDIKAAPTHTTSQGVRVTIDRENDETAIVFNSHNRVYVATLTVEIPEDYSGDAAINLMDAMNIVKADLAPAMPGQRLMFNVRIINHSAHAYKYADNSMTITDTNLDGAQNYYGPVSAVMDGLYSYTGKPLCTYGSVYRVPNAALCALNCTELTQLTDEHLGAVLAENGYAGGIEDLAKYYVDYYNRVYQTSHTRLDEFTDDQLARIFNANKYPEGIETYEEMITETNEEAAQTGYAFFYNVCNTFGVSKYDSIDGLTYQDVSNAGTAGVAQEYGASVVNGELDSAFESLKITAGSTVTSKFLYYTMSGRLTNNFAACMNVGFEMGLRLTQADSEVTVNKTDSSNSIINGAQFMLYQNVTDGAETARAYYSLDADGNVVWTSDADAARVFDAGTFKVNLPLGTYYLTEITAPGGYNRLTSDVELVVDESAETFYVVNTTSGGGGGGDTPTPPPTPDPGTEIPDPDVPTGDQPDTPVEPDQPVDIDDPDVPLSEAPKTGDLLGLWLALTGISGMGLAGMRLTGRKKEQEN